MNCNLKYEEIGMQPYFCCRPENGEENTVCFEMLVHTDMPGFVRPLWFENNGISKLSYPLSGCENITDAVKKGECRNLKNVIMGLCEAAISYEEYMLDDGMIPGGIENVFWNQRQNTAELILIPCKAVNGSVRDAFSGILTEILRLFGKYCDSLQVQSLSDSICLYLSDAPEPDFRKLRRIVEACPSAKNEASLYSSVDGRIVRIGKEKTVLGRDREKCTVLLENSSKISRIHAEIEMNQSEEYFVCDLNSSNGTFLNGNKLIPGKKYALKNCSLLSFAGLEYRFFC